MDFQLLIFIWIANCVGVINANENFLRDVRVGFEHGRKIAGWNSRASWIRQVKGAKRSPSIRELEKWWQGPLKKHKGAWNPSTDFWLSSPLAEQASNGFMPLFPTKGWKSHKNIKPHVPRFKKTHFKKGLLPHVKPWAPSKPPKSWSPRKIKNLLPLLKDKAPKRHGWRHRGKRPQKDYVPLMKDLIPKTAESWPPAPVDKCWPMYLPECTTLGDELSIGPKDERSVGLEMEKPEIMNNFFTAFNDPPSQVNTEDTENKNWNNEIPTLTQSWSSVASDSPPLVNEAPHLNKEWPPAPSANHWSSPFSQWSTTIHSGGAPPSQEWSPPVPEIKDEPVAPLNIGANSFLGWRLTSNGWAPPSSFNSDSWTPISSNEWRPLSEWSPPKNTWAPPTYSWFPPANDWAPMTQEWAPVNPTSSYQAPSYSPVNPTPLYQPQIYPPVNPTPLYQAPTYSTTEPISITSTAPPESAPQSDIYWSPPNPHQWAQMGTNLAKEIKGLIDQVTNRIF